MRLVAQTSLLSEDLKRGILAIGLCIGGALLIASFGVWLAFLQPAPAPNPVRAVPTVTVTDYYYFLENPEDYYAGKCAIASESAAPDFYAAHPGMVQCKFKKQAK